jgi:adenosylcobyric acid synthase
MAALVGTLDLLLPEERPLVKGLIVNRFRGDVTLFRDGVTFLEERTALPVLGVVPYVRDLRIADEDSVALDGRPTGAAAHGKAIDVAVVRLPHIANFDDFVPLEAEPSAGVRYVERADDLGWPDVLILPGTKSTMDDLDWLRRARLAERIVGLAAAGVTVIGICGGFQMLGQRILDPLHVESPLDQAPGLGLLPVETTFAAEKRTVQVEGRVLGSAAPLAAAAGAPLRAYEIHMGQTRTLPDTPALPPAFELDGPNGPQPDGVVAQSGTVIGTYLHGLFDNAPVRSALLSWVAARKGLPASVIETAPDPASTVDAEFDRLAAVLRESLDITRLYDIVGLPVPAGAAGPSAGAAGVVR